MNNLYGLLKPPHFDDEKSNQQAGILHVILWSLLVLAIVYLVFALIFSPETVVEDLIISAVGILMNFALLVLLSRRHLRLASILQVASFWLTFTAIALVLDGVFGPAYMMGYILVILIAGILLEGRGALVMTLLCLIAGMVIGYIQKYELLQINHFPTVESFWVTSAFMFPMVAILQYLASQTMRQAITRASESEQRYRGLSDAALEGVMVHRQGLILDVNRQFAEMFGYENPDELIGRNGYEVLLTPASGARVDELTRQNPDGIFEVDGVRKDGTVFPGETQSRSIVFRGNNAKVVAMRDISQFDQDIPQLYTPTPWRRWLPSYRGTAPCRLWIGRLFDLTGIHIP